MTAVTTGLFPSFLQYPSPKFEANHSFSHSYKTNLLSWMVEIRSSRWLADWLLWDWWQWVFFQYHSRVWSKFGVEQGIRSSVLPLPKRFKPFLFPPQSRPLRCLFGTSPLPSEWRSIWSGNPSGLWWRRCTFFNATCHFLTLLVLSSTVSLMRPPPY